MSIFSRFLAPLNFRARGDMPTPAQVEVATRQAAEWMTTAMLYLPNPDEVLRKLNAADGVNRLDLYRRLLNDDRVGSDVETLKAGVKSLDWQLDAEDEVPEAVVELCRDTFKGLKVTNLIGEMLDAMLYGMQPLERTWVPDGKRVWLKNVEGKPAEWFVYDTEGKPRFLQQGVPEGVPLETWPWQFQIVRHDWNYRNPYGSPLLARAYWPVVFKKGGLKFWITFLEKWGMPHAIARIPDMSDRAKVAEWLRKLQGLIRDSVAVLSEGGKVELLEPKGGTTSGDLYNQLIAWADNAITTVLLGHQGASSSTPGKLGDEKMAAKTSEDRIWAGKNLVQEEMNVLLRDIVTLNFGEETPAPTFSFYEKEDVDVTRSERDKNLLQADPRIRLTDQYLKRAYGFQEGDYELADVSAGAFQRALFAKPGSGGASDDLVRAEQSALEELLAAAAPAAQGHAEAALKPLLDLIRGASSFEEVRAGLEGLEAFDAMDTEQFEAAVQQVVFLAESLGRMRKVNDGRS